MREKRPGRKIAAALLIVAGLAGLVVAGLNLAKPLMDYRTAQKQYAGLREDYVAQAGPGAEDAEPVYPSDIDLAALQAQNPDCIGWIEIPGTNISYPVMQGADNDAYLRRSFDKSQLLAGSIFMDWRCQANLSGAVTILYGHNMRDGSMFSALENYLEPGFLEEHRAIYLHTPAGVTRWRATGARSARADDDIYQLPKAGQAAGAEQADARQLVLSTCGDGRDADERVLLLAEPDPES